MKSLIFNDFETKREVIHNNNFPSVSIKKEKEYELYRPGDILNTEGFLYIGECKRCIKYIDGKIKTKDEELKNYLVKKGHILLNEKETIK